MDSIRHSGPLIWNSLNPDLTSSTKLTAFKVKLKLSLLSESMKHIVIVYSHIMIHYYRTSF